MMKKFVYYPITQSHLILSSILRDYNSSSCNSIILDELFFTKNFINKISENSNWDKVYVIKKHSKLKDYIYKNILYKQVYSDIFQLQNVNLVIYSFGDHFTNTVINSIYGDNNILLGEDGIFPYYGVDVIKQYYDFAYRSSIKNKLKVLVKRIVNRKSKFDAGKIDKLLVMNAEWLPREVILKYKIEQLEFGKKAIDSAFDELTTLYGYKRKHSTYAVDIVFFDSGLFGNGAAEESEWFDILLNVFNQFPGMRIFIKLRPTSNNKVFEFYNELQKKTSSHLLFDSEESKYPWEIIYYNNASELESVIFMGMDFSTAFISSKKYFNIEHNIVSLRNIFVTERMKHVGLYYEISDFIERVKETCISKSILTPSTFDDVNNFKT